MAHLINKYFTFMMKTKCLTEQLIELPQLTPSLMSTSTFILFAILKNWKFYQRNNAPMRSLKFGFCVQVNKEKIDR